MCLAQANAITSEKLQKIENVLAIFLPADFDFPFRVLHQVMTCFRGAVLSFSFADGGSTSLLKKVALVEVCRDMPHENIPNVRH